MSVRAVIVSMVVICMSFGLTITNAVGDQYKADTGQELFGQRVTPFISYGDMQTNGVPLNAQQYNQTMGDATTFNRPNNVVLQFDFFQSLKYAGILTKILFSSVFGFFYYLYGLGVIPLMLRDPLTLLLGLNHLLALIYIITGRTFIY